MHQRPVYKITLFAPSANIQAVVEAISKTGANQYGEYSNVFWRTVGVEQFTPLKGANPASGEVGKESQDASVQLVFSIPRNKKLLGVVLNAIKRVHAWEEPVTYIEACKATSAKKSKKLQ